jgi:GNAT superfamily N-acetyltransferase
MMKPEVLLKGYFPGAIGKITELHATYYAENWHFDLSFEVQVATELSAFLSRFDPAKDVFLTAFLNDLFVGSIAIDGGTDAGARLRWFIVNDRCKGKGIGLILIKAALEMCTSLGHNYIYLWTFNGLDAARHVYEKCGFQLAEEHSIVQWGDTIREQKFELFIGG